MNGMPQQPNQGPNMNSNNWGQLLAQLAQAYTQKQQAMAPPQPTPVQLPSAPPDIPLPPAQGNAWNRASDNQRTPGHPMYDVRTQMDQQMAELKKTTDKYFADKQWSIGQGPPKPTVVDLNAPQQSAQPAPAQPQAASQPSGGQPQQQSSQPSYQSGGGYSDTPTPSGGGRSWGETVSDPKTYAKARTPKATKGKGKGDSKAKDKGTTNPSNRQMMIDPMMQAKMKSPKEQGRVTAGEMSPDGGASRPTPEGYTRDVQLGLVKNSPEVSDETWKQATRMENPVRSIDRQRVSVGPSKGGFTGTPDPMGMRAKVKSNLAAGAATDASAAGRKVTSSRGPTPSNKSAAPAAQKFSDYKSKQGSPSVQGPKQAPKNAPDLKNPKAAPPPNQRPNNAPYDPKAKMYEKGKKPLSPGDPGYEYSDYWKKDQALNKRGKFSVQDSGVQVSKSKPKSPPSSGPGRPAPSQKRIDDTQKRIDASKKKGKK